MAGDAEAHDRYQQRTVHASTTNPPPQAIGATSPWRHAADTHKARLAKLPRASKARPICRVMRPGHEPADITGQGPDRAEGRLEEGQTAAGDVGPPRAEAATWPARAIRSLPAGSGQFLGSSQSRPAAAPGMIHARIAERRRARGTSRQPGPA
jgi:hypothetical protein